ncbi:MAG TPA: PilZ domain-containing protein [Anaeromyxobacteraceae bacterium]|nr:PilZ domain-containing protein [Anaeromyxobacteraceae bacterium]
MLWYRKETKPSAGHARRERRDGVRLDKVFPVYLDGVGGVGMGIARNISEGGMFVETRAPQPIGSQVRVTFEAHGGEMTAVAEVRYVCHLLGRREGAGAQGPLALRGMGMRFIYFEPGEEPRSAVQ